MCVYVVQALACMAGTQAESPSTEEKVSSIDRPVMEFCLQILGAIHAGEYIQMAGYRLVSV